MPDQKISADPINTSPTASASLAGIDPGVNSALNYRFQKDGVLSWLGLTTITQSTKTANYTLALVDNGTVVEVNMAGAGTVTVPPNSSVAFPIGTVIEVCRIGAGSVTLVAGSGVTLRNPNSGLALRAQYSTASIRKRATDEWVVSGDFT